MFGALSAVQRYVMLGLLIALIAALAGWGIHAMYLRATIASQAGTIREQSGSIKLLEANLTIAVEANTALTASLETQNKQVNTWLAEVEKRKLASDAALAKAKADGERWKKMYGKILDAPPSNPSNDCESLAVRMDQYLELRSTQ